MKDEERRMKNQGTKKSKKPKVSEANERDLLISRASLLWVLFLNNKKGASDWDSCAEFVLDVVGQDRRREV